MSKLWRNGRQFISSYFTSPARSIIKYHGLLNQGATCYLNSVLQVLFMTKEFREAVKRHSSENPHTECIDEQLTILFEDLKKYRAYTYRITNKLGINNVNEQRDAAEYFEKILTSVKSPEASQIFQGQLTHKNRCSCGAETDTHGPFWSLRLELVDSEEKGYRVVDGIDKYFRSSDVSGANQMYCVHCDAKSDATIKCAIKHHPEVLTLLLRRFKYDDYCMRYIKVECSVDVPSTLQIPEGETYELYGFVDHRGSLSSGHYTATIKSQDDETWYNFNDTIVGRLPDSQQLQSDSIMTSSSAYLLFYRKKNVKAADTPQDIREVSTNGGFQSDTSRSEQSDVKTGKRVKDEEAAENDKWENKKKRRDYEDQGGKQEQHCVCVEKQGDDEKLVIDVRKVRFEKWLKVHQQLFYLSRSIIKYHGLLNQGATCYLNSVLQVLFMTKEFREAVKRHSSENPHTECIDEQLTILFEDLKKYPAYTYRITNKLGINNVYEQRDAAEYFEKILTSVKSPEASQIFQGQLTHKNRCSCGAETDTHGPFWSLHLELVDSEEKGYRVVDGIDKYFRSSDVSGANQMYCVHCDAKSDATIKCAIKHHPEVLTLLLRRFKYDDYCMRYIKVECSVDVPSTLQIPEGETYELYGFVDHLGSLSSGHYTATIKSQDDETWYNFNDTIVSRLPDNQQSDRIMTSSSAYLLFYRKKNVKAADTPQDIREVSTNGGFQSDTSRSEQSDVKTRKRVKDEEAAEGDLHTGGKQKNNNKRRDDEDQEGKQVLDCVRVDKPRDEEKLVIDVEVDKEVTTGAGEKEITSVSKKLLTKSDLHYGFQDNEGVGDSKEKNQGISNTSPNRHEQQREEKRDVKEDKEQMTRELKHAKTGDTSMTHQDSRQLVDVRREQRSELYGVQLFSVVVQGGEEVRKFNVIGKRDGKGDKQSERREDERAQRGTSESHCSEDVEDHSHRGLDDDRQNRPQKQLEDEISHKNVGVERQIEEEEKKYKHIQKRREGESFTRQTGSAGSRFLTEKQRHSVQMTPCDQEKKNVMEDGSHRKQAHMAHFNIQSSNETKTFGDSLNRQLSDDKGKEKRDFDPKEDDVHTLTDDFHNLKL